MLHLDASRKRETFVPDKLSDLVQGTLEVLVLKTLALEPIHGYGISVRIEQMSRVVISRNSASATRRTRRRRMEADREQQSSGILRSDREGAEETQSRNARNGAGKQQQLQGFWRSHKRPAMSLLRNLASGLRSLFQKEQVDRELDEELRAYEEMAAKEKMKDGMSRNEALRAVRLERGSLEVSKEIVRSGGWESTVEHVGRISAAPPACCAKAAASRSS